MATTGTTTATGPVGSRHLPLVPAAAFVVVWSSGYIAGPYGVRAMAPLMLLAVRFVLAAGIALVLARVLRGPLRVSRADFWRIGGRDWSSTASSSARCTSPSSVGWAPPWAPCCTP